MLLASAWNSLMRPKMSVGSRPPEIECMPTCCLEKGFLVRFLLSRAEGVPVST